MVAATIIILQLWLPPLAGARETGTLDLPLTYDIVSVFWESLGDSLFGCSIL